VGDGGEQTGRVVVGVDFADRTEAIVTEGLPLARATKSELLLVHAAAGEPGFAGYDADDLESHTRDARAVELTEEHRRLRELAEHAAAASPGTQVRPLIAVGPTAATLLRVADEAGASHLVVGTHGHGGLHHLLVGSVTEQLLRHAACPVVVVPVRST
jgi:nucleotide-binding universal stress UspA family protein